ncbi:MAG: hypothetical protein A3J07_03260 [Candidatus Doudnabacteria bacterium RIFCSPLOWO2_02_FULL_49_13]|uniref:Nudix hydrolase domain-containing protein n=1 Tax=Candidatus Doudnabacteria bacterium RIFCSPHIGHO2_12_FULL_48_16 TaxID=1817838 RepID=A0A1F5PIH5_9BACT|nr:MAG: hypothetical protein A3B77_02065 [Candidatus Doudnabacteria bacterium RIFCSPHIGHO2_02_FULL_49_24]OGE89369.1 MAG: hypothetical protein A2760_03285 [Candidatus Doudnabacteria bacterium RIFCSPHIGHO2_01_FULL_50_67]OGE89681.1 MAG: hypothetical protein A3E29_00490 [Candidatus Doudnabacteria bacterium RIFCSPHIGHO2_12_FULL_48_16]OGE97515.1 MAG: hypothetical protein A2990_02230 [Candidatus Doudnabacteria bacterium RIFCSPLOWO2_01_FULL_49_40]OGF03081.1 MAG: hypothetical protein A3J07_03260 [Candid
MEGQRPKVGLGVMIKKDGKFLFGRRKSEHAKDLFAPPGGHMEYAEGFIEAVSREAKEESGLEIQNVRFLCLSNIKDYMPKHYVNIGFIADWKNGEPQELEPDKMVDWRWYELDNIPRPVFSMVDHYIKAIKTGKNFFDA